RSSKGDWCRPPFWSDERLLRNRTRGRRSDQGTYAPAWDGQLVAGFACAHRPFGRKFSHQLHLVSDPAQAPQDRISILSFPGAKQRCQGGTYHRNSLGRSQPGSSRAHEFLSGDIASDGGNCPTASRGVSSSGLYVAQLLVMCAGRHNLVLSVLFLHYGREPDGPLWLFKLDFAYGQHHYLQ